MPTPTSITTSLLHCIYGALLILLIAIYSKIIHQFAYNRTWGGVSTTEYAAITLQNVGIDASAMTATVFSYLMLIWNFWILLCIARALNHLIYPNSRRVDLSTPTTTRVVYYTD